jgi:alkyl hydroperoxide reductase subunit AhpC
VKRNAKIVGLSVDSVETHQSWKNDIREARGDAVEYPLIADTDLAVSRLYHMLPADETGLAEERTAVDNATVRTVFVIGPDKRIKMMLSYPMSTGRNFDEILRVIDSLQLTATYSVATPANWQYGEDVIIVPSISDEDAAEKFPGGWETVKPYLRVVAQPR